MVSVVVHDPAALQTASLVAMPAMQVGAVHCFELPGKPHTVGDEPLHDP